MVDQRDAAGQGKAGDGEKRGRGRPPKHSQFKPGQSGNPSGRGKGTRDWAVVIEEELAATVSVTEGGKVKRLTKQEVAVKALIRELCQANLKAWPIVLAVTSKIANDNVNPFDGLPPEAIANFLARNSKSKEGNDE